MKKKTVKIGCDNDYGDDEKHGVGRYKCELCGTVVCKKCYEQSSGECMDCPPPMLLPIKK